MDGPTPSRTGRAGAILGSLAGGLALGGLGIYAFVVPDGSLLWSLSFVVAFLAAVSGFLAPLVLFLHLGSTTRSPSVYRLGGYLASIVSIFVLALFGTWLLPIVEVETPLSALVLFDAVIGGTVGGIVGAAGAKRIARTRSA